MELNDLNKINFYSQYYFQKEFNDITTKDFKTIYKFYSILPEDGLRLYNAFLKQYLKEGNLKQISKLEKFFKNNLIKFADNHFKKKSTMTLTNDLVILGYLSEISLNLLKYQEKNPLAIKILNYAKPKFVKHINNQLYSSILRPGSESIMYLADAKVDYVSSMHGDRFVIDNPGAQTTCGCGSSFSV